MVQSGEIQGCVGCHEERRTSAPISSAGSLLALRQGPAKLTEWYGPPRVFSYMKEVQPVFDRHCLRCHDYGKEGAEAIILAADRDLVFNTSYNELWRKKYIAPIGAGRPRSSMAYSWGSHPSRLVDTIRKPHHKVNSTKRVSTVLSPGFDINAPYYPVYASAYPDNLAGRSPLDGAQIARLTKLTGVVSRILRLSTKTKGRRFAFERPELSPVFRV
jgi:hypothetical protein